MNDFLKHITWAQYLLAMAVLAFIYYTVVVLLYYRKELFEWITSGRNRKGKHINENPDDQQQEFTDDSSFELMDDLESTVDHIEHSILEPGKMATKQELMGQLRERVANFGGLSRPGYRYALNNFIIEKAKQHCGVDFSEDELEDEWNSLPR